MDMSETLNVRVISDCHVKSKSLLEIILTTHQITYYNDGETGEVIPTERPTTTKSPYEITTTMQPTSVRSTDTSSEGTTAETVRIPAEGQKSLHIKHASQSQSSMRTQHRPL